MTPLMWCALRQRSIEIMEGFIVDYGRSIGLNSAISVSKRPR